MTPDTYDVTYAWIVRPSGVVIDYDYYGVTYSYGRKESPDTSSFNFSWPVSPSGDVYYNAGAENSYGIWCD